ncbi:unnamed protein product [Symbiodinium sp. CCMP2592]|nr:unnamed protein product [Symbiodinium sp. CCMP2592]
MIFGRISCLRRSALEVNTYHLSSGIAASARRNLWAAALHKLQEMHSYATPPNEYSLSSAIVAGQQEGQWRVAVNILSGSGNPGLHQHEILSAGVMRASVEAGCWDVAVEILLQASAKRLHPTERTFNAAMAPSGRDNWAQSAGLLQRMRDLELWPDVVSFNSLMGSSQGCADWTLALHLLCSLRRLSYRPTAVSRGAAASSQPWRWAVQLTRNCRDNASRSSVLGFGYWSMALQVLHQLPATALRPDARFGNEVLRDCATDSWQWSLQLLHFGGEPDLIRRNSVLGASRSGSQWEIALALASLLGAVRLQIDSVGQAEVAGAIAKAGRWALVLSFFRGLCIQRHSLDTALCSLITTACVDASEWQRALHLFDDMAALRLQADAVSCNTRLWAVAANSWQSALRELARAAANGRVDAVSCLDHVQFGLGHQCLWTDGPMEVLQLHVMSTSFHFRIDVRGIVTSFGMEEFCGMLYSFSGIQRTPVDASVSGGSKTFEKSEGCAQAWNKCQSSCENYMALSGWPMTRGKATDAVASVLMHRLARPLCFSRSAVIAMLTGGSLDDWAKNPEYVLEEVTRRKVKLRFGTFEDRCCDNGGLGDHLDRLAAAVARDVDGLFGRSWAAKLQITPKEDTALDAHRSPSSHNMLQRKFVDRVEPCRMLETPAGR